MDTRQCIKCGETKPLSEFHRHTQNHGTRPRCKTCRSAEHKATYDPGSQRSYYANNKEAHLARGRAWRLANPERKREMDKAYRDANKVMLKDKALIRAYGITLKQWEELFERQGRVCLICRSPSPGPKGWHTDHGVTVRGILCHYCNLGLGMFNHDIVRLKSAIRYLAK